MTSDDGRKLSETGGVRESDAASVMAPARPVEAATGFTSRSTGMRDLVIVLALLAALAGAVRALLAPMTSVVVGKIPVSVDETLGEKLGDVQRMGAEILDDARAAHLQALVAEVEPRVRALVPADALAPPRVTLLANESVNAFALPGGELFVFRGLLEAKGVTDDVLAGVLAHEIAHAACRHGIKGIVRRNLLRSAAVVLVGGLDAGTVALVGGSLSLGDLAYDRAMESEADAVAAKVLVALGRPVEPMAAFLEGLDSAGPAIALFRNHPAGRERAAAMRALAAPR